MLDVSILIVDATPPRAESLASKLAHHGFHAKRASDGETAMRLLDVTHFDAVVSDIHLPGINGYQLCKWIRRNPRFSQLAFIFHGASVCVSACSHDGDAFLTDPVDTDELMMVIRGCIVRRTKGRAPALR